MRNKLPFVFAGLIIALLVASPFVYKSWLDKQYRNFHVVEEGVLYRSAQLPLPRLQQLCATHGIRTVISLRDGKKIDDQTEEIWVKAKGLNFVRIPPEPWFPDDNGNIPAEAIIKSFHAVMDDPANYPVLVHCYAGIHRTGTMCALFRMDYQGWSNTDALAEMRMMGYSILDDHEDLFGYLARYRPQHAARTPLAPAVPASRQIDP
jgi:tyrosine-protein phosphatase SIW14